MTDIGFAKTGPKSVWPLDLHGANVPVTNFGGANLSGANLSGVNAAGASFRGADFQDAILSGINLRGADLSGALHLTETQLMSALIDENTQLPDYIDRTKLSVKR